jgi:hypothetical protein
MKQKICFLIHTEYHLLLSLYAISTKYSNVEQFEIEIILKRTSKGKRLKQELDLSFLPYTIRFLDIHLDLKLKLNSKDKNALEKVLSLQLAEFNFFQEQDPVSIILINEFKRRGTKINLYQDGLKPYIAHSMRFSPMLVLNNIKQNIWIRKNSYPVLDYWSFINCKMYGFLKGIDTLQLTFPKAYLNWNKLPVEAITPQFTDDFVLLLKRVFKWEDSLLTDKKGVIFFMNQPMHDDGSFEVNMLKRLQQNYPAAHIYIKNHPSTPQVKIDGYKELEKVTIINSKIPAELFISQLKDSIVLSVCSTSMFIDNSQCKFYYTFGVKEKNNIKRLKNYDVINPTNHVISCQVIDEIVF